VATLGTDPASTITMTLRGASEHRCSPRICPCLRWDPPTGLTRTIQMPYTVSVLLQGVLTISSSQLTPSSSCCRQARVAWHTAWGLEAYIPSLGRHIWGLCIPPPMWAHLGRYRTARGRRQDSPSATNTSINLTLLPRPPPHSNIPSTTHLLKPTTTRLLFLPHLRPQRSSQAAAAIYRQWQRQALRTVVLMCPALAQRRDMIQPHSHAEHSSLYSLLCLHVHRGESGKCAVGVLQPVWPLRVLCHGTNIFFV